MTFLNKFESGFLFSFTRAVSLILISIALIVFASCVFMGASSFFPKSVSVSKTEIASLLQKNDDSGAGEKSFEGGSVSEEIEKPLDAIKLPFSVQKYFSSQRDIELLNLWLSPYSKAEREQIIDEIEIVIDEAEANKLDVDESLNLYHSLKVEKYRERLESQQPIAANLIMGGVALSSVIIIALFTLVLVLLAIERNTRK